MIEHKPLGKPRMLKKVVGYGYFTDDVLSAREGFKQEMDEYIINFRYATDRRGDMLKLVNKWFGGSDGK